VSVRSSRRTLLGWSAMAFAGLLSGCSSEQTNTAVPSKELNLYAWSEYIPKEMLTNFTKQTGIKVNYDTFSSNEELLAKLQAGATGYDLVIVSDYTVAILKGQNQLESLDKSQLPNLVNIGDEFKNPPYDPGGQFTVPYQWGTVGLAINTEKVKQPITRWADPSDATKIPKTPNSSKRPRPNLPPCARMPNSSTAIARRRLYSQAKW
jgi:spermidine/putrescine-binding protein